MFRYIWAESRRLIRKDRPQGAFSMFLVFFNARVVLECKKQFKDWGYKTLDHCQSLNGNSMAHVPWTSILYNLSCKDFAVISKLKLFYYRVKAGQMRLWEKRTQYYNSTLADHTSLGNWSNKNKKCSKHKKIPLEMSVIWILYWMHVYELTNIVLLR